MVNTKMYESNIVPLAALSANSIQLQNPQQTNEGPQN